MALTIWWARASAVSRSREPMSTVVGKADAGKPFQQVHGADGAEEAGSDLRVGLSEEGAGEVEVGPHRVGPEHAPHETVAGGGVQGERHGRRPDQPGGETLGSP